MLLKLAERCEEKAMARLAYALDCMTETSLDLSSIDFALECFERADALKARASQ